MNNSDYNNNHYKLDKNMLNNTLNNNSLIKKEKKEIIGRITFDIVSSHIKNIDVKISKLKVKLKHFMNNNEIGLKVTLFDPTLHELIESKKIQDVKAKDFSNCQTNKIGLDSVYEWQESDENSMTIFKKTSWPEFKKSYLNVLINETQYLVLKDEISNTSTISIYKDKKENEIKDNNSEYENLKTLTKKQRIKNKKVLEINETKNELCKSLDNEKIEDTATNYIVDFPNENLAKVEEMTETEDNDISEKVCVRDKVTKYCFNHNRNKSLIKLDYDEKKEKDSLAYDAANKKFLKSNTIKEIDNNLSKDYNKKINIKEDNLNLTKQQNNLNENLELTKQNSSTIVNATILSLKKYNTLTKYDFHNFKLIEKKIEEELEFDVEKKYKQHGITEIHFNEILEEKDRLRTKQSSKVFQYFSRHYKNKNRKQIEINNRLKMEEIEKIARKHSYNIECTDNERNESIPRSSINNGIEDKVNLTPNYIYSLRKKYSLSPSIKNSQNLQKLELVESNQDSAFNLARKESINSFFNKKSTKYLNYYSSEKKKLNYTRKVRDKDDKEFYDKSYESNRDLEENINTKNANSNILTNNRNYLIRNVSNNEKLTNTENFDLISNFQVKNNNINEYKYYLSEPIAETTSKNIEEKNQSNIDYNQFSSEININNKLSIKRSFNSDNNLISISNTNFIIPPDKKELAFFKPNHYYSINNDFLYKEKTEVSQNNSNKEKPANKIIVIPNKLNKQDIFYLKNHDFLVLQVSGNLKKKIVENVYYRGEVIGTVELLLDIKNIPMIRQIQCGVHTERGFDISSHYLFPAVKNSTDHKEINELYFIYSDLIKKLSENSGLKTIYSQRQSNLEIKKGLVRLNELLKFSIKENGLIYHYNNHFEIIKMQQILILLASELVSFFESVTLEIKNMMFSCIETILSRLELNLDLMILEEEHYEYYQKFIEEDGKETSKNNQAQELLGHKHHTSTDNKSYLFNNNIVSKNTDLTKNSFKVISDTNKSIKQNIKEFIESKVKVASNYIDLVISVLEYVLQNISRKVHDEASKEFNEFIMSYSYFRLNAFQEEFLSNITTGVLSFNIFSQRSIVITSDNLANNNRDSLDFENILDNPVNSLIDWDSLFHEKYIRFKFYNFEFKQERLKRILEYPEWKEKIKRRGVAFYSTVLKLKTEIKKKLIAFRNIRWKDIPGFSVILDCIYHDLNIKEVKTISNSCVKLMKSFINDSVILNKFVQTMILKTNVYDVSSVVKLFDILHSLFQEYNLNRMHSNFAHKVDYNLLKRSIIIIIDTDQFLCIRKVLWFFYYNAHIMNLDSFSKLMKLLLSEYFFKLFFHWSYQVRNIFYYFLLFIINHKLRTNHNNEFGIDGSLDNHYRRKSMLLEKLSKNDGNEFMSAVKKDYLLQLKNLILNTYYSKLRIIMLIISQIKKLCKKFNSNYSNNNLNEQNESLKLFSSVKSNNTSKESLNNNFDKNQTENNKIFNKKVFKSLSSLSDDKHNKFPKDISNEHISPVQTYNPEAVVSTLLNEDLINKKEKVQENKKDLNFCEVSTNEKYYCGIQISKILESILTNQEVSTSLNGIKKDYILSSIIQYRELEEQYKIWEKEAKNNNDIRYPKLDLQQMKDDVVDYTEDLENII
jgi:hypothetical protein